MSLFRISVLVALAVLLQACGGGSSSGGTASYYVDAVAGDDAATGTSVDSAWKTLTRLNGSLPANARVYLKRGSIWNESLVISAAGTRIDAYGSGELPLITGYRNVDAWAAEGGGIYSAIMTLANGEALGHLAGVAAIPGFLPWKGDMATTFSGAADEVYSYDWAADTLYLKTASAPAGGDYRASVLLTGVRVEGLASVTISNIAVSGVSLHGIELKSCSACSVNNVQISGIGGAVVGPGSGGETWLYAGNGIEFSQNSSDGLIENAVVADVFDSCLTVQTYASAMSAAGFSFTGAELYRCGFAGIELSVLSNGGSTGSELRDVTMTDMLISDAGKGWSGRRYGSEGNGIRVKADAGAGSMSAISLQRAEISGSAGDGVHLNGDIGRVSIHRLRSHHNDQDGINVADATDPAIALALSSSIIDNNSRYGIAYFARSGFEIYHSSFYDNGSVGLADFTADEGSGQLRNNVFSVADTAGAMAHIYLSQAPAVGQLQMDYNCYREKVGMIGSGATQYDTLADWSAATVPVQDANSLAYTSALLTDAANNNFSLVSGSGCIGSGDGGAGVVEDYLGAGFASPAPSRGAVESAP